MSYYRVRPRRDSYLRLGNDGISATAIDRLLTDAVVVELANDGAEAMVDA